MICTRLVLEYFPRLVDFTINLNLNDKQRGALIKLQHFVGKPLFDDEMESACIYPFHEELDVIFEINNRSFGDPVYDPYSEASNEEPIEQPSKN